MTFSLSVRLLGEYEDAFLYKDHLYLWTTDYKLIVVNWQGLVQAIAQRYGPEDAVIIDWSFAHNDSFRTRAFAGMERDRELSLTIARKLRRLASRDMSWDRSWLQTWSVAEQDFAVEEMTDVVLYRDSLYVSSRSGAYGARVNDQAEQRHIGPVQQITDAYTVSISAKHFTLNTSCCEEGLFCWRTLDQTSQQRRLYHYPEFTRATSWLYHDFFTLGDESFKYHLNETREREDRRDANDVTSTENEGAITKFGARVLSDVDLTPGARSELGLQAIFTQRNSNKVFFCRRTNEHFQVHAWRRPRATPRFLETGLTDRWLRDVYSDVFRGFALYSDTIVLDTDGGTLVLAEDTEPFWLSQGVNVVVRTFPDSAWYTHIVCSVKEDHLLISCLWPFDPISKLGPGREGDAP